MTKHFSLSFQFCSKSLSFILWSLSTEKIAEAGRKFTTLKNELYVAGSLKVGPSLNTLATSKKMTLVPKPSDKVKAKTKKKASELKFAFGEFYLSLILLQNYQVLSSAFTIKLIYSFRLYCCYL